MYSETDKLAEMDNPITFAMKASADPDTFYHHQAMKQPDARQFKEAMVKEVNDHTKKKHWEVIEKKSVPREPLFSRRSGL
jgi:predicted SnoaL-like aldol condensation-catalyzing enzyme